jgi:hypothetical protein
VPWLLLFTPFYMLRTGILLLLLLLQTAAAWAIKPLATYWAKPDTLGLKYQDLTLHTTDDVQLASWLVEPRASTPYQHTTMVVASGDWGNMSYSLYQAKLPRWPQRATGSSYSTTGALATARLLLSIATIYTTKSLLLTFVRPWLRPGVSARVSAWASLASRWVRCWGLR